MPSLQLVARDSMMSAREWRSLDYLRTGAQRQKDAHAAIEKISVMDVLCGYDPILVGTIPIDIDIESSDLDMICCAQDLEYFSRLVQRTFGSQECFQLWARTIRGRQAVIAAFRFSEFTFEIYAQREQSEMQYGFRHMVVESRLLDLGGARMRDDIRRMKREGVRTEPAFAMYLGLNQEDPYESLLRLEEVSEEDLAQLVRRACSFHTMHYN